MLEVAALYPHIEEPDFILSLGTGEPTEEEIQPLPQDSRSIFKNGVIPRVVGLAWEKMRDGRVRQAFRTHPRYHRLDIKLGDREPRLDDIRSIPDLKSKVDADPSLPEAVNKVAEWMIASLFYFRLDSDLEWSNGTWTGSGKICCLINQNDPAYQALILQLTNISAAFWLDDSPIAGRFGHSSFTNKEGNFRKSLTVSTADKFSIKLKRGKSMCDISGSPFSIEKLAEIQGKNAVFGTADHRKRRMADDKQGPRKRLRKI